MVVEVKLMNEPTDKTYWFEVGHKLEEAIIRRITMYGEIKDIYVLVDTAQGYKVGKMLDYSQGSSPDGIYPTRFAISLLNSEQTRDFLSNKEMKDKQLELENKVNNLFYKLRNSTTTKVPLDAKIKGLRTIADNCDDPDFATAYTEISLLDLSIRISNLEDNLA